MIHNNMRGIKSIGAYEAILCMFMEGVPQEERYERLSLLFRSYCAEHADANYMVYSVDSTDRDSQTGTWWRLQAMLAQF
jgi:hypothetical protein